MRSCAERLGPHAGHDCQIRRFDSALDFSSTFRAGIFQTRYGPEAAGLGGCRLGRNLVPVGCMIHFPHQVPYLRAASPEEQRFQQDVLAKNRFLKKCYWYLLSWKIPLSVATVIASWWQDLGAHEMAGKGQEFPNAVIQMPSSNYVYVRERDSCSRVALLRVPPTLGLSNRKDLHLVLLSASLLLL